MTQQYSTRAQRIIMLITLLVLILVIAKNVAAGTTCAVPQKATVKENNEGIKEKMIKSSSRNRRYALATRYFLPSLVL